MIYDFELTLTEHHPYHVSQKRDFVFFKVQTDSAKKLDVMDEQLTRIFCPQG